MNPGVMQGLRGSSARHAVSAFRPRYRKFETRYASVCATPRATIRLRPSGVRLPRTMPRSVRLVIFTGGPPDTRCNQTLARSTVEYSTPSPFAVHSSRPLAVAGGSSRARSAACCHRAALSPA